MEPIWKPLVSNFLGISSRPLIVVLGPTASGKTGLSIEIAGWIKHEFGRTAEVVNADSRQFYRGLDIGTAKITSEEMRGITHHLLSVLDPKESVSIAWFQRAATEIIDDMHARGNIPLLVGGSMLYISAIVDGLQPLAASDPKLRERLSKEYDVDGGKALHARLTEIDPESAQAIPIENKVYLLRALEIYELTGVPKSKQHQTTQSPYDVLMLGVAKSKPVLDTRIGERIDAMFKAGWKKEVMSLIDQGYTVSDPGMQSHGYPEMIRMIGGELEQKDVAELVAAKTRQYAKRQLTWWKDDKRIHWL